MIGVEVVLPAVLITDMRAKRATKERAGRRSEIDRSASRLRYKWSDREDMSMVAKEPTEAMAKHGAWHRCVKLVGVDSDLHVKVGVAPGP